ncbi:MAG: hypothetical protein IT442_12845 [Phycisphaeraceae bacterium]|nr:hypothetical protein [Phycisphaeraceae bacterium]
MPPSRLAAWMPLLLLIGAVAVMLAASSAPGSAGSAGMMIAWLLLLGWFVHQSSRTRQQVELDRGVSRVQDASMLRRHPEALRLAWSLLPSLRQTPQLHARLVAMMAHDLAEVGADEAALTGLDYLLERVPREHPISQHLSLERAILMLSTDRLSDGDEAIRRLRHVRESGGIPALAAMHRFAELYQMIRTNHFADAIEGEANLAEDLRPLGVEAGYGYGLMALAHYRLDQWRVDVDELSETAAGLPGAAGHWWSMATLLLSPAAAAVRFPELGQLIEPLRPSQSPSLAEVTATTRGRGAS